MPDRVGRRDSQRQGSLTESQRLALKILAEHRMVAVANITHMGYAGRYGVRSPGIAAATARWLVSHGYATRLRYVMGELVVDNERGNYVKRRGEAEAPLPASVSATPEGSQRGAKRKVTR